MLPQKKAQSVPYVFFMEEKKESVGIELEGGSIGQSVKKFEFSSGKQCGWSASFTVGTVFTLT